MTDGLVFWKALETPGATWISIQPPLKACTDRGLELISEVDLRLVAMKLVHVVLEARRTRTPLAEDTTMLDTVDPFQPPRQVARGKSNADDLHQSPPIPVSMDYTNPQLSAMKISTCNKATIAHSIIIKDVMKALFDEEVDSSGDVSGFAIAVCRRYQEKIRTLPDGDTPQAARGTTRACKVLITMCELGNALADFDLIDDMDKDFQAGRVSPLADLRILIQHATSKWMLRLCTDTVAHGRLYEANYQQLQLVDEAFETMRLERDVDGATADLKDLFATVAALTPPAVRPGDFLKTQLEASRAVAAVCAEAMEQTRAGVVTLLCANKLCEVVRHITGKLAEIPTAVEQFIIS